MRLSILFGATVICATIFVAAYVLRPTASEARNVLTDTGVVDCSEKQMKQMEKDLRKEIEPYLNTTSEEYSGRPGTMDQKEAGRNRVLVKWLKALCTCQWHLDEFDKTLCLALKQNFNRQSGDNCLIRY